MRHAIQTEAAPAVDPEDPRFHGLVSLYRRAVVLGEEIWHELARARLRADVERETTLAPRLRLLTIFCDEARREIGRRARGLS